MRRFMTGASFLTPRLYLQMEVQLSEGEGYQLVSGSSSRQFCLCGGLSESTKFNIKPLIVGEIDIEATVSY